MRPRGVVVLAEVFDDDTGLGQGPELLAVQAFVAEAGVERFHKAVLPRARRGDVDGLDFLLCSLALEFLGDELRAVVGPDELGGAMLRDRGLHELDHVGRTDLAFRPQPMHFLGVLIEHGEHAQGTAMHRGVGNKVLGPYMTSMVRLRRQPGGCTSAWDVTPGRWHPQAFGPPQLLHLLAADLVAFHA